LGLTETEIFLQKGLDKPFRKTRSDLPVRQNRLVTLPWRGRVKINPRLAAPGLHDFLKRRQPVGWVERSDTHRVVASPCWRARMTGYRRNFIAGGSFFFVRL
jgi:hypothetical protein